MGDDDLPYATINYANGPGYTLNTNRGSRKNLNKLDMENEVKCRIKSVDLLNTKLLSIR